MGIGEDGWEALAPAAQQAIEAAGFIVGSSRQLALLPQLAGKHISWPTAMMPFVDELLTRYRDHVVVILASGDPMLHGIGATLARRLDPSELRVIPSLSAFTLACARLAWPSAEVTLLSAVSRPLEYLHAHLQPHRRIIVYSQDGTTPSAIAALLSQRGYGKSVLHVFEHLGGAFEARHDGIAATWEPTRRADLNLVAISCEADDETQSLALVPGLPDDVFETDGQLTKREVRAATLARLGPLTGQLLWDVGAGTGSISIEWMRTHPACRAIAFEHNDERAQRIVLNATRLGVPNLRVVAGNAPSSFAGAELPDAIFIGGGITHPSLFEASWQALARGGRLVANAVTIEGEAALVARHATLGGDLVRIAVSRAQSIGSMLCWRPLLPITQWAVTKR